MAAALFIRRGRVAWSRELRIRAAIEAIVIVLVRLGVVRDRGLSRDVTGAERDRLGVGGRPGRVRVNRGST